MGMNDFWHLYCYIEKCTNGQDFALHQGNCLELFSKRLIISSGQPPKPTCYWVPTQLLVFLAESIHDMGFFHSRCTAFQTSAAIIQGWNDCGHLSLEICWWRWDSFRYQRTWSIRMQNLKSVLDCRICVFACLFVRLSATNNALTKYVWVFLNTDFVLSAG